MEALTALDDSLAAAESVIVLSRRQRSTQTDVEALREAKESYCHSIHVVKESLLKIDSRQPLPESEIEVMRREKEALQHQLNLKQQQLMGLLSSIRELVSMMERWHRWEIPASIPERPTGGPPRLDSEVSSMDIDL